MKLNFFIAIFFMFVASCNYSKPPINEKKMTQVLLELHLAEALSQNLPKDSLYSQLKNEDSLKTYTAQVFQKNMVSEKEFSESMNWYKNHPEMLDSMYQNILSELAILQSKK